MQNRFFDVLQPSKFNHHQQITETGQVVVGGEGGKDGDELSSVEFFPRPLSDACVIPDLLKARADHSLSLLPGGRLVVCGGSGVDDNIFDSCISWGAGNKSWTPFYTMRCLYMMSQNLFKIITLGTLDTHQ